MLNIKLKIKNFLLNIYLFIKFSIKLLFDLVVVSLKILWLYIYHGIKILYHSRIIKLYKLYWLISTPEDINWKKLKAREFLINSQRYQRDMSKEKLWLKFSCYFYEINSQIYLLTKLNHLWAWIKYIILLLWNLFRLFSLNYTIERYIRTQKFIIKIMFFVWFVGFTWSYHNDRFLYTYFMDVYMINWLIWQTGTYCFRIKFMSWWDYVRAFSCMYFWWTFHSIISFPVLHWLVDRLDKTVDYESMGWVYKFEEYLESKGWMPKHQHTNKRKKELQERTRIARERSIENYFARKFYNEEQKWTLLNFMRWQQERLMDEDDPEFQKWNAEHQAKLKKKLIDDIKKKLKKGEVTMDQVLAAKERYETNQLKKKLEREKREKLREDRLREKLTREWGPRIAEAELKYPEYRKRRLAEMKRQQRSS